MGRESHTAEVTYRQERQGRALLALVLAVLTGCSSGFDGGRGPSCGSTTDRNLALSPDAVDFAPYLRWQDRMYLMSEATTPVTLGPQLGEVRCRRSSSLTPVLHTPQPSEAAFLEPGTGVFAVRGRPTSTAVATRDQVTSEVQLFLYDESLTRELG